MAHAPSPLYGSNAGLSILETEVARLNEALADSRRVSEELAGVLRRYRTATASSVSGKDWQPLIDEVEAALSHYDATKGNR